MLPYIKNDLKHNVNIVFSNRELFIADLAKRKQYQIARDMGLTSTQMSFFISIFWALKEAQDIHISSALEALDDTKQLDVPKDTASFGLRYGTSNKNPASSIPLPKDEEGTE